MKITVNLDVVKYLDKHTLWTLIEDKLQYYVEEELMGFIENTDVECLIVAPVELNVHNDYYYKKFVCGKIRWIILYCKYSPQWYEVVRIITPYEKDYDYF
jgi:hypothetical protein